MGRERALGLGCWRMYRSLKQSIVGRYISRTMGKVWRLDSTYIGDVAGEGRTACRAFR